MKKGVQHFLGHQDKISPKGRKKEAFCSLNPEHIWILSSILSKCAQQRGTPSWVFKLHLANSYLGHSFRTPLAPGEQMFETDANFPQSHHGTQILPRGSQ